MNIEWFFELYSLLNKIFLYNAHCTMYTEHCTLYNVHNLHCVIHAVCGGVFTVQCTMYSVQFLLLYQHNLTKMRALLTNLNHCAVPFLSRAAANLCWCYYNSNFDCGYINFEWFLAIEEKGYNLLPPTERYEGGERKLSPLMLHITLWWARILDLVLGLNLKHGSEVEHDKLDLHPRIL